MCLTFVVVISATHTQGMSVESGLHYVTFDCLSFYETNIATLFWLQLASLLNGLRADRAAAVVHYHANRVVLADQFWHTGVVGRWSIIDPNKIHTPLKFSCDYRNCEDLDRFSIRT